ncbi:MAG: molybdopterin-dependent oxidoreductase [Thiolinea sp.]
MADVTKADVIIITGANPSVNHPVGSSWMKNAVRRGTQLILLDPRRSAMARYATQHIQFKPSTDVALLNAMMHTIVEGKLGQ